jgi:hypothetical protein
LPTDCRAGLEQKRRHEIVSGKNGANDRGREWMKMVRQLESVYATDGRTALNSMGAMKAYVLYEEKSMALAGAEKMLAEQPANERRIIRLDQLKEEVSDIAGWFQEKERAAKERDRDRER